MTITRLYLVILAIAAVFVWASFALAHDHNRPDLDGWFHGLHARGVHHDGLGAWCCEGPQRDALHLRDADWETKDSHYRVKIPVDAEAFAHALRGEEVDTMWVDVPDEAVIDGPNKDEATLVWPTYGYLGPAVRCFMPGSMT